MLREFIFVALGGALGAISRFGVSLTVLRQFGPGVVWGTLFVNVVGGLAMGLLAGFAGDRRELVALLGVGFLGGFTTFSAFSIEIVRMIERGGYLPALAYAAGSVILSVGAAFAGHAFARSFA
jgi:CrcB protein